MDSQVGKKRLLFVGLLAFIFFCGLIYFIHVLTACRLAEVVKRVADVKEDPILGKAFVLKPVVN